MGEVFTVIVHVDPSPAAIIIVELRPLFIPEHGSAQAPPLRGCEGAEAVRTNGCHASCALDSDGPGDRQRSYGDHEAGVVVELSIFIIILPASKGWSVLGGGGMVEHTVFIQRPKPRPSSPRLAGISVEVVAVALVGVGGLPLTSLDIVGGTIKPPVTLHSEAP